MTRIAHLFLAAALAAAAASLPAQTFWERDVWREPERPFLFYGESAEKERKALPARPLEAITSLAELKAERERRLERAVMDPSRENILAYLEANAFVQHKAAAFSDAWRDTLLQNPRFDWTALHPTVNLASTTLSREREQSVEQGLHALPKSDWGLIFFADGSRLTELMAPIARRFAAGYGFELVTLSVSGDLPLMPGAAAAAGLEKKTAGGLTHFPALVLVKREKAMLENARIIATGVVDSTEIGRRLMRLTENHQKETTR